MSLQDMKKLPHLSPDSLEASLANLDQDLDRKLLELKLAKDYITKKRDHIREFQRLSKNQYLPENPDYNQIYLFSINDTGAWSVYIKDQYQCILLYDPEKGNIETGLAVPTQDNHPKLWEKDNSRMYLSFVLKVEYSNPSVEDFEPHINYLNSQGYQISNIFARYLFSACDERYYDYYKAFAEVIK
jgi:hypothetical protein